MPGSKDFITSCDDRALEALLSDLVNRGFGVSTLDTVKQNLNKTSYDSFARLLSKSLNLDFSKSENDARLHEYLHDLSKDISNQYNAHRHAFLAKDLKYHWFRYSGSNLTTTRPFCIAMTKKDYFHSCEIPSILKGDFDEFNDQSDPLFEETEIPTGFYQKTTENNFQIYRGGYGCGHQIYPIPDNAVPTDIRTNLFKREVYKIWLVKNHS